MFLSFRGGLLPATSSRIRRAKCYALFALSMLLLAFFGSGVQTQSPQANRGVIRLKVRYKSATGTNDLPRKRFFLVKGSLDQNKSLIEKIQQTGITSRDCYYRSKGASAPLVKWLKDNDCES